MAFNSRWIFSTETVFPAKERTFTMVSIYHLLLRENLLQLWMMCEAISGMSSGSVSLMRLNNSFVTASMFAFVVATESRSRASFRIRGSTS